MRTHTHTHTHTHAHTHTHTHRQFQNADCILMVLCIVRVFLTVNPVYDIDLIPHATVLEYLSIKINDLVVLAIWILITVQCAVSIWRQHSVLGSKSFQKNSFDIRRLGKSSWLSVGLDVLLTGVSATYIPRLVYFIYMQWTTGFNPIVQTLQLCPALMMVIQTAYQGTFLLRAHTKPSSLSTVSNDVRMNEYKVLDNSMRLNGTLLLHCACITILVECFNIDKDIVLQLAAGETLYRLWAIFAFWHLKRKVGQCSTETDQQAEETPGNESDQDETCSSVTSGLIAPVENDRDHATGSICEDKITLDFPPEKPPSETWSAKDPIAETTALCVADSTVIAQATEGEDIEYSKLVVRSLCKEVQHFFDSQQFFESQKCLEPDNLVSPEPCVDNPTRVTSELVVPKASPCIPNFS